MACEARQGVESVFCGVDCSDRAPCVVFAAPAPVEVEVVVLVVAVAHEGVTALPVVVLTAVIQRDVFIETAVFQHLNPFFVCVAAPGPPVVVGDMVVAVKSEIVAQSIRHIVGVGAAATAAVLHVDRDAAMMQELSDIEIILFSAQRIQCVRHKLKMIFCLTEVGGLLLVTFRIIGVRTCSDRWPVVEFHHLTHCCGDAACIDTTAAAFLIFRTLAVVRPVLVPDGLAYRSDHRAVASALFYETCCGN